MKKSFRLLSVLFFILTAVIILTFSLSAKSVPEPGNANFDNKVDGRDATLMLKYLADWDVKVDSNFSDVNADGKIKGNDATLLLKKLADWGVTLHSVREYYIFTDFSDEIKTDGSADITEKLQACVNEHDNVFIPEGEYLQLGCVTLHDNSGILGEENTLIRTSGNSNFSCAGHMEEGSDVPVAVENIEVRNLTVKSDKITRDFIVNAASVDGIYVDNLNAEKIGLVNITTIINCGSLEVKEDCSHFKYLSRNATITNCYGDGCNENMNIIGSNMWTDPVGMQLTWLVNIFIDGNEIHRYYHGIQYWGGGPISEPYENNGRFGWGTISNNTVYDICGGGIWGTMPKYLTVSHNTVWNCDDIGIDYEGGDYCTTEYNTVFNCFHNFAIFEACSGHFVFRHNYSYFDENAGRYFTHFNFKPKQMNPQSYQEYIFEDNIFEGKDRMSIIGMSYYLVPILGGFTFRNNTCINTTINTLYYPDCFEAWADAVASTDIWNIQITDNTFDFTLDNNCFSTIELDELNGAAIKLVIRQERNETMLPIIVTGNKITAKTGLAAGIAIEHGADERCYEIILKDNEISDNCDTGIVLQNTTNGSMNVICENNTLPSIITLGDGITFVSEIGNVNTNGNSVVSENAPI